MTEEELMRDVYIEFQFDLCRACQKAYVSAPLAKPGHCMENSAYCICRRKKRSFQSSTRGAALRKEV